MNPALIMLPCNDCKCTTDDLCENYSCLFQSQLTDIYEQFSQCVHQYKEFWDMMGEIDRNTWVLEPEKPTYSAVHRRIAISMLSSKIILGFIVFLLPVTSRREA